jgi:hypothetical protein
MNLLESLNTKFENFFKDEKEFPRPIDRSVFSKGAMITDYGQVERKLYFMNSGLVQLTGLHDGEEKIVEFFSQGNFVCAKYFVPETRTLRRPINSSYRM